MTKVREDSKGLFIIAGGYKARPGDVNGYSHAYRMDSGGLVKGDTVKAYHMSGSPLTRLTLADGTKLVWHHDGLVAPRATETGSSESTPRPMTTLTPRPMTGFLATLTPKQVKRAIERQGDDTFGDSSSPYTRSELHKLCLELEPNAFRIAMDVGKKLCEDGLLPLEVARGVLLTYLKQTQASSEPRELSKSKENDNGHD